MYFLKMMVRSCLLIWPNLFFTLRLVIQLPKNGSHLITFAIFCTKSISCCSWSKISSASSTQAFSVCLSNLSPSKSRRKECSSCTGNLMRYSIAFYLSESDTNSGLLANRTFKFLSIETVGVARL